MFSPNVEKSKLLVKNSNDELEQMPSKFKIRCCDVVILLASFAFTISVACFILLYVDNVHQQNKLEIENIVEKIIIERLEKSSEAQRPIKESSDDPARSKRAIHDFRSTNEPPIVEFFNPKLRPELEKNDTEIMKKTGWKGAAPKGDSWVWLTSYSRIPFEAIEGFCKKTKEYCPPGPTGS